MLEPESVPEPKERRAGPGLSWAAMLLLVLAAILIAAGAAYLLVDPFFRQRPR